LDKEALRFARAPTTRL